VFKVRPHNILIESFNDTIRTLRGVSNFFAPH